MTHTHTIAYGLTRVGGFGDKGSPLERYGYPFEWALAENSDRVAQVACNLWEATRLNTG